VRPGKLNRCSQRAVAHHPRCAGVRPSRDPLLIGCLLS